MILAYGVHSKTVGKANKRQSTTFASIWVQPHFLWGVALNANPGISHE
jgi:hypothetical protein